MLNKVKVTIKNFYTTSLKVHEWKLNSCYNILEELILK